MIIFGGDPIGDWPRNYAHLCDECRYVTFVEPNEDGKYICKRCGREDV